MAARARRRQSAIRRAGALGIAIAIALSAVIGGRAYVFCAPMAEARAHCCCPHRPVAHETIGIECCDDRVTPTLPSLERASLDAPAIPPAPVVAVLALDVLFARAAPVATIRERGVASARDGPGPRLHARASVYLI
jgi:hypothetical protein